MHTITLTDGTKLENLELNGNNYIAPGLIEDSVFEGNLGSVTISDGTTTETHENMILVQNTTYGDGKSWFVLSPKSWQDKEMETLMAKIRTIQETALLAVESAVGIYEMLMDGGNTHE